MRDRDLFFYFVCLLSLWVVYRLGNVVEGVKWKRYFEVQEAVVGDLSVRMDSLSVRYDSIRETDCYREYWEKK